MDPGMWRISASLILAVRTETDSSGCDYKVLILKRSNRTTVIDNHSVFPGGNFEESDEGIEWLQYFEDFGVAQDALRRLVVLQDQRPSVLAPQGTGCYDRFFKRTTIWAREISLRITALRETFEETGILLCRNGEQLTSSRQSSYVREDFDKVYWQTAVHNDSREFLRLCKELRVVPDLWALFEWSAWGTPAISPKRRYETVFFMAFLPEIPSVLAEESEVKEIMWHSPGKVVQMLQTGDIWFLPPQAYEILRLEHVKSLNKLVAFTQQREPKGTTLMMPVPYACTDGIVYVSPGDDYYVADPRSVLEVIPIELSKEEFRLKTRNLHRNEGFDSGKFKVYLNFSPLNGHLSPVTGTDGRNKL